MDSIQRHFAPSETGLNSYAVLKQNKKVLLFDGINRFKSIDEVVTEIRKPSNDDPLFISKNSYWGPDIPKSAQKLLAALYIKEFRWGAFDSYGNFNYAAFERHVNGIDPLVSGALKRSYFDNVKLVTTNEEGMVLLAAPGHDYAVTMELPRLSINHVLDFLSCLHQGKKYGRYLSAGERFKLESALLTLKSNTDGKPVADDGRIIEGCNLTLGHFAIRSNRGEWCLCGNEKDSPVPLEDINMRTVQQNIALGRIERGEKYFVGARLPNMRLPEIDLSDAMLSYCYFIQANLSRANLRRANFFRTNLSNSDLSHTNLFRAYLRYANLSNADLSNADLRNADLFEAILTGANLSGARLNPRSMLGLNFSHVTFDQETTYKFGSKFQWDPDSLDLYLNHHNNPSGTLLTAIDSIDDVYLDLKRKFLVQLINSLGNVDISSVNICLREILCDKKYLENPTILKFVQDKVLRPAIASANIGHLQVTGPCDCEMFLSMVEEYMINTPRWPLFNSGFFVQLIRICFSLSDHEGDDLGKRAHQLYSAYLQSEGIAEIVERTKSYFEDEIPYIFFCKQEDGTCKCLVVSGKEMRAMLHSDYGCRYTDFFYFEGKENIPTSELKPCIIFETFKVFSAAYRFATANAAFTNFLQLLKLQYDNTKNENHLLTKDYTNLFFEARLAERCSEKLVDAADQNTLKEIFYRLLESTNGLREQNSVDEIKTEHLNAIYNVFNIGTEEDIIKAKWLYALAAKMFMYSSSHIFGTENDSPVAIRYYAAGLARAAHRLDSSIFGEPSQYKEIMDRATGNAFSCTALLTKIMMKLAKSNKEFETIFIGFFPPSWLA